MNKKKNHESISIEEYLRKRQKIKREEAGRKKKDQENTSLARFPGSALFVGGIIGGFLL